MVGDLFVVLAQSGDQPEPSFGPTLVMFGDGKIHPPYGLFGGKPGSCNIAYINEGTDSSRELAAKEALQLQKNDTYATYPSGGGGWGDPMKRDPELVRIDVKNGIVSLESARINYGVAIDADSLEIDIRQTENLRIKPGN